MRMLAYVGLMRRCWLTVSFAARLLQAKSSGGRRRFLTSAYKPKHTCELKHTFFLTDVYLHLLSQTLVVVVTHVWYEYTYVMDIHEYANR